MNRDELGDIVLRDGTAVRDWRLAQLALAALECGRPQAPSRGVDESAFNWGKSLIKALEGRPDIFVHSLCRRLERLTQDAADKFSEEIRPYVCLAVGELWTLINKGTSVLDDLLKRSVEAGFLQPSQPERGEKAEEYNNVDGLVEALIWCDHFDTADGSETFDRFVHKHIREASERLRRCGHWDEFLPILSPQEWNRQGSRPHGVLAEVLEDDAQNPELEVYTRERLTRVEGAVNSMLGAAPSVYHTGLLTRYWGEMVEGERPKLDAMTRRAFFMTAAYSITGPPGLHMPNMASNAVLSTSLRRRRWLALTWKERPQGGAAG